jgi:hypothetical protein
LLGERFGGIIAGLPLLVSDATFVTVCDRGEPLVSDIACTTTAVCITASPLGPILGMDGLLDFSLGGTKAPDILPPDAQAPVGEFCGVCGAL